MRIFRGEEYLTPGVTQAIPWQISLRLWQMLADMSVERESDLQRFELRSTEQGQQIRHTQENPPYQQERTISLDGWGIEAVNAVVYVIRSGGHHTMMLAEELPFFP